MFGDIYRKKGYESRLLSRTTEDAVTVTSVLIPWNTCGMTQATILSVPTLTYLPYCFFSLISPLMSILVAAIGYKIVRKTAYRLSLSGKPRANQSKSPRQTEETPVFFFGMSPEVTLKIAFHGCDKNL